MYVKSLRNSWKSKSTTVGVILLGLSDDTKLKRIENEPQCNYLECEFLCETAEHWIQQIIIVKTNFWNQIIFKNWYLLNKGIRQLSYTLTHIRSAVFLNLSLNKRLFCDFREAGCTPFAAAIIAEMFTPELRGSAMGIYNFGIYFGYSISYAFGNFLYEANIMGEVSCSELVTFFKLSVNISGQICSLYGRDIAKIPSKLNYVYIMDLLGLLIQVEFDQWSQLLCNSLSLDWLLTSITSAI